MRVVATVVSIVALFGVAGVAWWRTASIGSVQRGGDLAVRLGCLGCHANSGTSSLLPRSFAELGDVDPATAREWILDGMPAHLREDPDARRALEAGAIQMPAWRTRLSPCDLNDLVAYMRALAGADAPEDPAAREGQLVAERLGCFGCHGPAGRGAGRNPGSLKGYIPPWDGPDFAELVLHNGELREWILDGRPQRLESNPVARFFLNRQAIRMPSFRAHVTEQELQALEAYISWLRAPSPTHVDAP